jgi:hypothetical protein
MSTQTADRQPASASTRPYTRTRAAALRAAADAAASEELWEELEGYDKTKLRGVRVRSGRGGAR